MLQSRVQHSQRLRRIGANAGAGPTKSISSRATLSAISAPGSNRLKRPKYLTKSAPAGAERGRRARTRRPPRPAPLRRGRRIPENGAGIGRGRALRPAPQGTPASGGDKCRRIVPLLRRCRAARPRIWCLRPTSPGITRCACPACAPRRRLDSLHRASRPTCRRRQESRRRPASRDRRRRRPRRLQSPPRHWRSRRRPCWQAPR